MPYPYDEEPKKETLSQKVSFLASPIIWFFIAIIVIVGFYLLGNALNGNIWIFPGKVAPTCIQNCTSNITLIDNKAFDQGYAKAIADTQNSTLLLGYCSAQQEFLTNGALLMNNTTLIVPTSLFKKICFK